MHEINLYNIQIVDLEIFLAAAKYKSFTKAAEKMFTTQSWVSKRIQLMERELNLQLFIRNTRNLSLTPAGRVLAERLEHITDDIGDAITAATTAMTGTTGRIKIGFLEWGVNAFLDKVKLFTESNRQIAVEIYCRQFKDLFDSLEDDRIDLMLTSSYDATQFSSDDYRVVTLKRVPMMIYMNKEHRLADRASLQVSDLRAESILTLDQKSSEDYSMYISSLFKSNGIRPFVTQYAQNGREHLGNLLLNRGILIASEYFLGNEFQDSIVSIPLEDHFIDINAVWKTNSRNVIIHKFLKMFNIDSFN